MISQYDTISCHIIFCYHNMMSKYDIIHDMGQWNHETQIVYAKNCGEEPSNRALLGSPKRACLSPEDSACLPHHERLWISSNRTGTTILRENKRFFVVFLHELCYNGCNYFCMLGLRLIHVDKRGPQCEVAKLGCLPDYHTNVHSMLE